ncbi:putative ribonuclease H-like domain-containing protein [Tanacetum coccineum]
MKDWVSECDEDECEEMISDNVQHKSEPKPEQAKQPRKINQNPRNSRTNWNEKKTQKLGVGFQFTGKAVCVWEFNHLIKDCDLCKMMVQKTCLCTCETGNWSKGGKLGPSRLKNMTGNKSFLTDYQDYDGGYVAFVGSYKGVSHKCVTRKNSVLFTETECLILSPDFKLPVENQVMLKIPRKDNMYSFDLKNVVPSKGNRTNGNVGLETNSIAASWKQMCMIRNHPHFTLLLQVPISPLEYWSESTVNTFSFLLLTVDPGREKNKGMIGVEAMSYELLQFRLLNVGHWNKARLVAQGHRQEEGIDYDEVFAPVARIEAIRLFLAFASFMGFVYQMDVKSAFLYGTIEEEVYVNQPPGFVDLEFPTRVYKVEKALYGLHQAPRACFSNVKTTSTPMETHKPLLQDIAGPDVDVQPKASHMHAVKRIFRYLKGQPTLGLWYPKDSPMDLIAYSNSDYAGASIDRKSTTGEFIAGFNAVDSFCDKHNMVAYLEKLKGSAEFHHIIDFLTTSHIHYALTENPTIYASFIKQFWTTATSSTNVNGEVELTASIIFEALASYGYATDSDKLTFQKGSVHLMIMVFGLTQLTNNVEAWRMELKKPKKVYWGRSLIEELDMDANISLVPPHAKIQEKISDETEVLLEEEEATEIVQDQGSVCALLLARSAGVYIRRSEKKKKDKGKAILIEDESVQKKSKKKVQEERLGYEEAIRLQEQINKEERKRIAEEYDKGWERKEAMTEVDTAQCR